MISKTFVTAFVATCLMAGSSASPCKISSRTTEASTIAVASTTIVSTETTATAVTTAVTEKASSTADDTTTTALSSVTLSTTEQLSVIVTVSESSVETTLATTTVASSSEDSSVADSTSTEAESTVTSNESVATTTDGTTTAVPTTTEAATTTTAEAPSDPTFIVNAGFEDSSESVSPWSLYTPFSTTSLALDTEVSHDGQNSARLSFSQPRQNAVQQQLQGPITAGVTYAVSAWILTSIGCSRAYLECEYQGDEFVDGQDFEIDRTIVTQWRQTKTTCTFSQGQIDAGDLYVLVGFDCLAGSDAYVDTVSFTVQ